MSLDLLLQARRLIERREGPEGTWARCAALLTRQGLEMALDHLWAVTYPGVEHAGRATQLACLDLVIDDDRLVSDVRSAWSSLSRACHHHHYELDPTADELDRWIRQTGPLVLALLRISAPRPGPGKGRRRENEGMKA